MLRLRTEIWVQAYLRQCNGRNVPAFVVHKGDPDAGAIYIKVNSLNGVARVYGPAPQGLDDAGYERKWCASYKPDGGDEAGADHYLERQRDMDRDLWIIEVEDREGRHFLGEAVVEMD